MSTLIERIGARPIPIFGCPIPESSPTELHRAANNRLRQQIVQMTLFDPSEIPVRDYPFFVPIPSPETAALDFKTGATYNGSMVDSSSEGAPVSGGSPNASATELGGASIAGTRPDPKEGRLGFIDPVSHPLTLDEGRVVQRYRAKRSHAALLGGRRTTGALPGRRSR
mgnify:CR=1 FL=1